VSAFVPTNVISITDGQIFLETSLFNAGIRPAINAGISVSRVGGAAQTKLVKSPVGRYSYRLGSVPRAGCVCAVCLRSGRRHPQAAGPRCPRDRIAEAEAQYSPLTISLMGASLFAVNKGFMDDIEVKKVLAFEHGLHALPQGQARCPLLAKLEASKAMDKDAEAELNTAIGANSRSHLPDFYLTNQGAYRWQQVRKYAARSNRWKTPRRSPKRWRWWRPARCARRRSACAPPVLTATKIRASPANLGQANPEYVHAFMKTNDAKSVGHDCGDDRQGLVRRSEYQRAAPA
jgi:hypothetical protein